MAAGWFVVTDQQQPGPAPAGDSGRALLFYHRQIDELAERLGLDPLSGFFSPLPDEVAAYLRRQGVDPDTVELPDEEWHDPADGLRTVRGLIDHMTSQPHEVPQPEKVRADLEVVARDLESAERSG